MAVTNQPGPYQPSDFQTGLCDCCDDIGTCCFGLWCYPCLGCSIASAMDECCLCGLGVPIRAVYRTKYNIRIHNDIGEVVNLLHCCGPEALIGAICTLFLVKTCEYSASC
ncbi:hypothetical protein Q8A73_019455 [Channa argus]|nr:hypothetical protein Q8A73_019455 [Channa argus]